MTIYTAPPNKDGLVLNAGDFLFVQSGGLAVNTTLNSGSIEIVETGSRSGHTTINSGASMSVLQGGRADNTIIHQGGLEIVFGAAHDTAIDDGTLRVAATGIATNVLFNGTHSKLELSSPFDLKGTISFFSVGDVVDFLNTKVTEVREAGHKLMVTFGRFTETYSLVNQQPNTEFKLQSDGHGGTDLILVSTVGVAHNDAGHLV